MKKATRGNDGVNISGVRHSSINISGGDINSTTNINTGSGDIVYGAKVTTIDKVFNGLNLELDRMPEGPDKDDARDTLQKLEDEARKGNQASESRVQRWLNFLAETAPDVWDVAIETFKNPISGIGLVFKKVAERARK
jgi:hypothetical protein